MSKSELESKIEELKNLIQEDRSKIEDLKKLEARVKEMRVSFRKEMIRDLFSRSLSVYENALRWYKGIQKFIEGCHLFGFKGCPFEKDIGRNIDLLERTMASCKHVLDDPEIVWDDDYWNELKAFLKTSSPTWKKSEGK